MKAIYIVGYAPHWEETPWDEDDAEYWGMNTAYTFQDVTKFTRWFELHHLKTMYQDWPGWELAGPEHIRWLRNRRRGVEVTMWREQIDSYGVRNSVAYPLNDVLDLSPAEYFTNTVAWMLALAILESPKKIGVYGVDMAASHEFRMERPSVEYWLGLAQGQGIEVEMPKGCDLLKAPYLYGLQSQTAVYERMRARMAELKERRLRQKERRMTAQRTEDMLKGAEEESEYWLTRWFDRMKEDYDDPRSGR